MKKRVLVVDDAAFMRLRIKDIVEKAGIIVIGEAVDGREAVQKFQELKPDLVLLDITMPVMDGLTALRNILHFDPEATVVMISAISQKDVVRDALEMGAKYYITKPFEEQRIINMLKSVLKDE